MFIRIVYRRWTRQDSGTSTRRCSPSFPWATCHRPSSGRLVHGKPAKPPTNERFLMRQSLETMGTHTNEAKIVGKFHRSNGKNHGSYTWESRTHQLGCRAKFVATKDENGQQWQGDLQLNKSALHCSIIAALQWYRLHIKKLVCNPEHAQASMPGRSFAIALPHVPATITSQPFLSRHKPPSARNRWWLGAPFEETPKHIASGHSTAMENGPFRDYKNLLDMVMFHSYTFKEITGSANLKIYKTHGPIIAMSSINIHKP